MKNKKPTRRAALLLTLFILAGALFTAPASTALESGARYIVKIKNTAVFRRTDRDVPFETVSAAAELSGYVDADSVSGYARHAVGWAVAAGVITGTSDETVSPEKSASRAEVPVMLMRCVAMLAGAEDAR